MNWTEQKWTAYNTRGENLLRNEPISTCGVQHTLSYLNKNDQLHASKKEDSINYGKIIQSQASELVKKRIQVFQIKQELKLLREEVTRSRLPVNSAKNTVKFNVSRHSYWELDKSTRSLKRKKIRQSIQNAVEILPAEFKPLEVSIITLCAKLVRIRPWSSLLC